MVRHPERFAAWIQGYQPIPQEIIRHLPEVAGRSFTEISAYRYLHTLARLEAALDLQPGDALLDVGSFPGGWLCLLHEYYGGRLQLHSLGLSHPPELAARFAAAGVRVIPFDIDPRNPVAGTRDLPFPIPAAAYRAITFLETVEHLYDPLPALRALRRALQPGGVLLLTTDNPYWYGFAWQSLRGRRHPWGPVRESHLFNASDWRPHVRLYDLADLAEVCRAAGFRVLGGEEFNDRMGQYRVSAGRWRAARSLRTLRYRLAESALPRRLAGNHVLLTAEPESEPPATG